MIGNALKSLDSDRVKTLLNDMATYCETIARNIHSTFKEKIEIISDNPEDLSFLALNGTNGGQLQPSNDAQVFFDSNGLRNQNQNVKMSSVIFTSRTLSSLLPLDFGPEKNGFKVPPNPVINSAIVSLALFSNSTLLTLIPQSPITIRFLLLESFGRSRAQCVYWSKVSDVWSPEGCYVKHENKTHVECQCQHLSTFAVLMDQGEVSVLESSAIRIIVISAVSLTIILLAGYSIMFLYLTEIRSSLAHIHNCLSLSLILCNIIFLCGVDAVENQYGCMIAAIGLHYSWLAVFVWVAIESFHLYRRLSQPQLENTQRADRQVILFSGFLWTSLTIILGNPTILQFWFGHSCSYHSNISRLTTSWLWQCSILLVGLFRSSCWSDDCTDCSLAYCFNSDYSTFYQALSYNKTSYC